MKKLLVVLVILCVIFGFIKISLNQNPYERDMADATIFRDYEEDVLYAWLESGCGAGMTVMKEKDGTSKIHNENSKQYKYTQDISNTTIFVDYEEMTMYTWYGRKESAGMSVMLKANGTPKIYDKNTSSYKNIEDISSTKIFVDKNTNVMYSWYKKDNGGGLSVMLKADGTPKLYDKEISSYKDVVYISGDNIFADYKNKTIYFYNVEDEAGDIAVMLNADGTIKKADKFALKYFLNSKIISNKKTFVDNEENVHYIWMKGEFWAGLAIISN